MFKKNCFIVEDNEADKSLLVSFIEKTHFLNLTGTASSYAEAVEALLARPVDILFLDIDIAGPNGLNGFDILKTIPEPQGVIITSNYSNYAVDSYALGKTSDFILKPLEFDRYLIAINRALSKHSSESLSFKENVVFFKMGRRFQKFNIDEILYFEAYGIYVKLFTEVNKAPHVINESLIGVLEQLNNNMFIRVHKSFIVNVMKIESFDSNHIFIDSYPVPLGVSYKSKIDYLMKLFVSLDD